MFVVVSGSNEREQAEREREWIEREFDGERESCERVSTLVFLLLCMLELMPL